MISEILFKGDKEKASAAKNSVIDSLGLVLPTYRVQIEKADPFLIPIIHQIYKSRGGELERPVLRLLNRFAPSLKVTRIKNQKAGEADYAFYTRDGKVGIIQLGSKANPRKAVPLSKAGQVLQQSPELHPEVFVCIGFPKFDLAAELKANAHGENLNYKAVCLPDLIELCLSVDAGNSKVESIYRLFEEGRGLVGLSNYL